MDVLEKRESPFSCFANLGRPGWDCRDCARFSSRFSSPVEKVFGPNITTLNNWVRSTIRTLNFSWTSPHPSVHFTKKVSSMPSPPSPTSLSSKLHSLGLPQAYRSVLTSLSAAPPSVLSSRRSLLLHAAGVVREIAARDRSALKIQSVNRGKAARKSVGSVEQLSSKKGAKLEAARRSGAAMKVQAAQRGKMGRCQVRGERARRDDFAAARVQAVQRRRLAEVRVDGMRREKGETDERELADEREVEERRQEEASTKLQAVQRGRAGRREQDKTKQEGRAATVMQSVQRRRAAAKAVEVKRETKRETNNNMNMDAGARKIQSIQRARKGKEEWEEKRRAVRTLQAAERGRSTRQKNSISHKSAAVLQARKRGADGRAAARQAQRAQSMAPVGDGKIHIGDVVKAKIRGEPLWCEGIVIGRSGDGGTEEFDVDFGEGDVQEHVPAGSIRKVLHWDTLEVGDHVKAPVPGFVTMKGDAEVVAFEGEFGGEKLFTIKFDDGEVVEGAKGSTLVKATSSRTQAVVRWRRGLKSVAAVGAFADKKWGAYRKLGTAGGLDGPGGLASALLAGRVAAERRSRGSKELEVEGVAAAARRGSRGSGEAKLGEAAKRRMSRDSKAGEKAKKRGSKGPKHFPPV